MKRRVLVRGFVALAVLLAAIQFVPVERSNPPVLSEVPAGAEVRAVLERACYDCHSNQTRWPAYARVAPISWLIARDVREGRAELNFSEWERLDPARQAKALRKSREEIEEGEMPPWFYLPLHPEARLSPADRSALGAWFASAAPQASARPKEETP